VISPKFAEKQTRILSRKEHGSQHKIVTLFRKMRLEQLLSFGLFLDVCTFSFLMSTASAKETVTVYFVINKGKDHNNKKQHFFKVLKIY
jgi:hypothetical protein